MENREHNADEEPRSSIWTVPSDDLAKFFFVYVLIYVIGAACVVWLQITRAAAPHDIASGIITGVSLIGIGIAPSLALVLVETWRVVMIFTRSLELKQQRRETAIRTREREIQERDRVVKERDRDVQQRDREVQERDREVQERDRDVQQREAGVHELEASVQERDREVKERDREVQQREAELAEERARFERERDEFERRKNGR